jgi:hypothetical protein
LVANLARLVEPQLDHRAAEGVIVHHRAAKPLKTLDQVNGSAYAQRGNPS